jgi:GTP cyclohydrolase FolE2
LEDIQKHRDDRDIAIEQVGVTDLRYPITVLDRAAASQRTIADLTLSVGLPHDTKGTHMSRFIEVLERHRGEITVRTLPGLLADIKTTLEADSARIEVAFPYIIARSAPASGARALMDYRCRFVAELDSGALDFVPDVAVPVSSLCPDGPNRHPLRGSAQQQPTLHPLRNISPHLCWTEGVRDECVTANAVRWYGRERLRPAGAGTALRTRPLSDVRASP